MNKLHYANLPQGRIYKNGEYSQLQQSILNDLDEIRQIYLDNKALIEAIDSIHKKAI